MQNIYIYSAHVLIRDLSSTINYLGYFECDTTYTGS